MLKSINRCYYHVKKSERFFYIKSVKFKHFTMITIFRIISQYIYHFGLLEIKFLITKFEIKNCYNT